MGGVILRTRDWRPRRKWERRLGLKPGSLERMVFEGEASQRAMIGGASVEDIWESLAVDLGLGRDDREALRKDFFAGDFMDQELISFIESLRPGVKTGLISNAWPNAREFLEASISPGAFDQMVISAEIAMAKPDPGIYRLALDRSGVPAEAALFVDDMPRNLRAAAAAGIRPILFNGTRRTIEAVRKAMAAA